MFIKAKREVTFTEYDELMNKIIKKNLQVHETLIEMLEEAASCIIVDKKRRKNEPKIRK